MQEQEQEVRGSAALSGGTPVEGNSQGDREVSRRRSKEVSVAGLKSSISKLFDKREVAYPEIRDLIEMAQSMEEEIGIEGFVNLVCEKINDALAKTRIWYTREDLATMAMSGGAPIRRIETDLNNYLFLTNNSLGKLLLSLSGGSKISNEVLRNFAEIVEGVEEKSINREELLEQTRPLIKQMLEEELSRKYGAWIQELEPALRQSLQEWLDEKLEKVVEDLTRLLTQEIGFLKKNVDELWHRLSSHEETTPGAPSETVEELMGKMSSLEERVERIYSEIIEELGSRLDSLESRGDTVSPDAIEELKSRVNYLEEKLLELPQENQEAEELDIDDAIREVLDRLGILSLKEMVEQVQMQMEQIRRGGYSDEYTVPYTAGYTAGYDDSTVSRIETLESMVESINREIENIKVRIGQIERGKEKTDAFTYQAAEPLAQTEEEKKEAESEESVMSAALEEESKPAKRKSGADGILKTLLIVLGALLGLLFLILAVAR